MSAFDVWLWLKLDDVRVFMWHLLAAGIISAFLCGLSTWAGENNKSFKWFVASLCLSLTAAILGTVTPSTKQAAAIYVVPRLVESRVFTNDIPQLYGMAVDALKEKLAVEVAK